MDNSRVSYIKKTLCYLFLMIISSTFLNTNCYAKLSKIIPEPQQIVFKNSNNSFLIENDWAIIVEDQIIKKETEAKDNNPYFFCAQELKQSLNNAGFDLPIRSTKISEEPGKRIIIGNPLIHPNIKQLCKQSNIGLKQSPYKESDSRYQESYFIDVSAYSKESGDIFLIANGPAGIFYSIQTLLQMIKSKKSRLPAVRIIDYPDMRWRGYYVNFRNFRNSNKKPIGARLSVDSTEAIFREIDKNVKYKINTIIFSGKPFQQLDQENLNYLKQIFDYCQERFINPIPTVTSLLWGNATKDFSNTLANSVEGVWSKNEKFSIDDKGYAQALIPSTSIIPNGAFEIDNDSDGISDHWTFTQFDSQNRWTVSRSDEYTRNGETAARLIINRPKNFNKLALETNIKATGPDASLKPGSYYELGFWSRSTGKAFPKGKVVVEQYDIAKRPIRGIKTNFGYDFFPRNRYVKNWMPVFVHKNCSILKIRFLPHRSGSHKGDIIIDDVELVRMNGALVNVINEHKKDIVVTNKDNTVQYILNKDYKIEKAPFKFKPKISIKELEKTKIRTLPGSSIKKGQEVRISHDSVVLNPKHRNSRLCPSSPGTYTYYADIFNKLITLKINNINIHMSEHLGGFNRDRRCLDRELNNAELLSLFVKSLNDIVHNDRNVEVLPDFEIKGLNNKNIRLLMWDDMVNYWHNGGGRSGENYFLPYGGKTGATYLALSDIPPVSKAYVTPEKFSSVHIPKDVILLSWWYRDNDPYEILKNSPDYYEKIGFDYIGVTWDRKGNIKAWSKALSKSDSLGLISSIWGRREDGVRITADYAWKNIRKR